MRRVIGMDIHRTFAEVVIWEQGRRRRPTRRRTSRSGRRDDADSLPGRIHCLWRLFASRPMRLDASTLRCAADLVGLTDATSFDGLAGALRDIVAGAEHPRAAAVGASTAGMKLLPNAPPVDVEIFALWLLDRALAQRLRWGRAGSAARHGDRAKRKTRPQGPGFLRSVLLRGKSNADGQYLATTGAGAPQLK